MIRPAVLADVPMLVEMGRRFRETSEYRHFLTDNPAQREAMAIRLVEGPGSIVLVVESHGDLIGMIGLLLYPHHLSGDLTAGEVFWWMEPTARGTGGMRLLAEAEKWAARQGAKIMQMIAPNCRVGKLYERRGYQLIELAYQKQVA